MSAKAPIIQPTDSGSRLPPAQAAAMARPRARRWPWPRSLRARFAVSYLLVALVAVAAVAMASLMTVLVFFNGFQRGQIATIATDLAQRIGAASAHGLSLQQALCRVEPCSRTPGVNEGGVIRYSIIVEDTHGNSFAYFDGYLRPIFLTPTSPMAQALHMALHGTSTSGSLPANRAYEPVPGYAATPIRASGTASGPIIGAIYVTTPVIRIVRATLPPDLRFGAPQFIAAVDQVVLLTALGVALLMAALGALLARTITRPIERLKMAAARMAMGDYSYRVPVSRGDELGQLASAFNEMAARIEAHVREMQRQEALRRELVANVSHDLATPLTAIQGYIEALADGIVHDEQGREESCRIISKEVARLRRLVSDLQQMARLEAGASALDLAPLNLNMLVEETLAVVRPEFTRKGVELVNALPADLPLVQADADKITQVLLNLVDNALRYTPPGGMVRLEGTAAPGSMCITVRDTGAGIAAADLERIFDRFYRADPSRTGATGGSGLGLAIARAIIRAHGGNISATSEPGVGTAITFTLPVAPSSVPMQHGVRESGRLLR
jgi:two-component system sensor histidine kinase BaeS